MNPSNKNGKKSKISSDVVDSLLEELGTPKEASISVIRPSNDPGGVTTSELMTKDSTESKKGREIFLGNTGIGNGPGAVSESGLTNVENKNEGTGPAPFGLSDDKTLPIVLSEKSLPESSAKQGAIRSSASPSQTQDEATAQIPNAPRSLRAKASPMGGGATFTKVSPGVGRFQNKEFVGGNSDELLLSQTENLHLAQNRILDLEKALEKIQFENDELIHAAETVRNNLEDLRIQTSRLEGEKKDLRESYSTETALMRGQLQHKDQDLAAQKKKVEELEARLKSDFKKVRFRERDLENRLELLKAEKNALLRTKDEHILDLKKKLDQMQAEVDSHRAKNSELLKNLESNQESLRRAVKALRLALSNLGMSEEELLQMKKNA